MSKKQYRFGKNPSTGQRQLLHRLLMAQLIDRPLRATEVVHLIDGNPGNNRIENLLLLENQSLHMRLEHYQRRHALGRTCFFDLSTWLQGYEKS